MKKLRTVIWLCFMLLAGSVIHAVLPETEDDNYEYKFTFIAPLKWFPVVEGIQEADRKWNTNTNLISFSRLDEENYIRAIREAVLAGTDGIIAAGFYQSEELCAAILEAEEAGIPVVLIDSDLPESARSSYIGTDNRRAGMIAGQKLIEAADGRAHVAVITSDESTPNQKERLAGFADALKEEEGMELVTILECHSDTFELTEKVTKLFQEHPKIDALFLSESVSGTVVGNILRKKEGPQVRVVAFDNLSETRRFIEAGTYACSVTQQFYEEGYLAVEQLKRILQGEKTEKIIYTDVTVLRAENLAQYPQDQYKECEWKLYE